MPFHGQQCFLLKGFRILQIFVLHRKANEKKYPDLINKASLSLLVMTFFLYLPTYKYISMCTYKYMYVCTYVHMLYMLFILYVSFGFCFRQHTVS